MKTNSAMVFATLLVACLSSRVDADVVFADTTGADTFTTADFYGVQFVSGAGAIQSITYDLTMDTDAYFDFDGAASYLDATSPVLGTLVGLSAGDITSTQLAPFLGTGHPAKVRFDFAPGSFQAGDSLRFAADTDFFVSDPAPGGVFGTGGGKLTVVLEGGVSETGQFLFINSNRSELTLTLVPEPATMALAACALFGVMGTRRRGKWTLR